MITLTEAAARTVVPITLMRTRLYWLGDCPFLFDHIRTSMYYGKELP